MATGRQLAAVRAYQRVGRTVKLIRNFVPTAGVETRATGNEEQAVSIKGTFKNRTYPFPKSEIDNLREADEERGPHRERTFTFAAAAIDFEPTIDDRLIDGTINYAVLKVDPQFFGEVVITYKLVLKPI